jgi:hypothetical protein
MPRKTALHSRVRPDLNEPQADPTAAIAWAVLQKPDGWEIGEWLARLMPDGMWSDIERVRRVLRARGWL